MDDMIYYGGRLRMTSNKFHFRTDPIGISLSRSLAAVVRRLSNLTETDRINGLYGGLSQVVLVVAQSHKIAQASIPFYHRKINGRSFFKNVFFFITKFH